MRVGANARQHVQIKKMHAQGVPQHQIARALRITPQSMEKIIANLEGRDEITLVVEESPEVQRLRAENEALRAKLGEPLNGGDPIINETTGVETTVEDDDD